MQNCIAKSWNMPSIHFTSLRHSRGLVLTLGNASMCCFYTEACSESQQTEKFGALQHVYKAEERQKDHNPSSDKAPDSLYYKNGSLCMSYLGHILQTSSKNDDSFAFDNIYVHLCGYGLQGYALFGNYLISNLVYCCKLVHSYQVFQRLVCPSEECWISLIEGHVKCGEFVYALALFARFQQVYAHASSLMYNAVLKSCCAMNFITIGQEIHVDITKKGIEGDIYVGSSLVYMYSKFGCLPEAQNVIDNLPESNVVSWTALIAGYANHGLKDEVSNSFNKMQLQGVVPNAVTFVCCIKAYGNSNARDCIQNLHSEVVMYGFETNSYVGSTLLVAYANCSLLKEAETVFHVLLVRDLVTWNALITVYTEHGVSEEAFACLTQMKHEGISPDASALNSCLKISANTGSIVKGRELHSMAVRNGFDCDPFIEATLVDMYAKCGLLDEACDLFYNKPFQTHISWTALIGGYVDSELLDEALACFEKMQDEGIPADKVTYACTLRACGSLQALRRGKELHAQLLKHGFENELLIGNVLVDMYAKCGSTEEAQKVFDDLPTQNEACWSSLISGYTSNENREAVLSCLDRLRLNEINYDVVVVSSILKSCGIIGAVEKGLCLHAEIVQEGLESDMSVGNSLVDMYVKWGLLLEAQYVFDELSVRNAVSWTAMITGYACQGNPLLVFNLFDEMQDEGVLPDAITLLTILTVCCYGGLVNWGTEFVEMFSSRYNLVLTTDHYNCLIDLVSCTGQFNYAVMIFEGMPFQPNDVTLNIMLSACKKWSNVELAKHIFTYVLEAGEVHDAAYMSMFYIYAGAQMLDDVKYIEAIRTSLNK